MKFPRFPRISTEVLILFAVQAVCAFAASTTKLPWDTPLQRVAGSITGPVAYSATCGGIAVSGLTMVFHGDLGEFGRRAALGVLAGSTAGLATQIATTVIGITGALI